MHVSSIDGPWPKEGHGPVRPVTVSTVVVVVDLALLHNMFCLIPEAFKVETA